MLRQYGNSVDDSILTKLVSAFSELRQMADEGLIAYPYSTREVINIVRHIQVNAIIYCMKLKLHHTSGRPIQKRA